MTLLVNKITYLLGSCAYVYSIVAKRWQNRSCSSDYLWPILPSLQLHNTAAALLPWLGVDMYIIGWMLNQTFHSLLSVLLAVYWLVVHNLCALMFPSCWVLLSTRDYCAVFVNVLLVWPVCCAPHSCLVSVNLFFLSSLQLCFRLSACEICLFLCIKYWYLCIINYMYLYCYKKQRGEHNVILSSSTWSWSWPPVTCSKLSAQTTCNC